MKKITLIVILCVAFAGTSFAQNNGQGMKSLAIYSLVQYGQELYDRGDYNEASAVFKHVLSFDNRQPQALHYLKDMGSSKEILMPMIHEQPIMVGKIDISDSKALKNAIAMEKEVIKKLKEEIIRMRANSASQGLKN